MMPKAVWLMAMVILYNIVQVSGRGWDTKLVLYPRTSSPITPISIVADDNDCIHFLLPIGKEEEASYSYRKLRTNGSLSQTVKVSDTLGPAHSTLGVASSSELIFFMENNTGANNPLLFRISLDNGDTWGQPEVLNNERLPRTSLAFARNPFNGRLWLYYHRVSEVAKVWYTTRPPASRVFSIERPALNKDYGLNLRQLKTYVTYAKDDSVVMHLFALNEQGLIYAFSTDNGITYNTKGYVYMGKYPYDAAVAPAYSNTTVFVAVNNQIKWTNDFGTTWRWVNITSWPVANVTVTFCQFDKQWKLLYLAINGENEALYRYFNLPSEKLEVDSGPFPKRYTSLAPKLLCYHNRTSGSSVLGIVSDDYMKQTILHLFH